MLFFLCPVSQLLFQHLNSICLNAEFFFHVFAILASPYITKEAIERTGAVRINGVIIQKPWISPLGFIKNGLYKNFTRHGCYCGTATPA